MDNKQPWQYCPFIKIWSILHMAFHIAKRISQVQAVASKGWSEGKIQRNRHGKNPIALTLVHKNIPGRKWQEAVSFFLIFISEFHIVASACAYRKLLHPSRLYKDAHGPPIHRLLLWEYFVFKLCSSYKQIINASMVFDSFCLNPVDFNFSVS